jgi:hypothetical protein
MIDGHRLIVVTPAGRRRYLEVLARHVLACPEVNQWQLWANTTDEEDLQWMLELEKRHYRVKVQIPTWPHEHCYSIHKYFPHCDDPKAVYVRLDDDIVWMSHQSISRLARARIEQPEPFLWYGNVLNSAITSHLHQRANKLTKKHGIVHYDCMDPVGWNNGDFAVDLHHEFFKHPNLSFWQLQDWELYHHERHSINAVAWLGSDSAWVHEIDKDEEQWLAVEKPRSENRPNRILGSTLFVHYAFFPQRSSVDADASILNQYRTLAPNSLPL